MKKRLCLLICLALAGALLPAWPAWAQNQGGGPGAGPGGQGQQLCTGGPGGTCALNPATNQGNQNCPGYGAGKNQKRRGMKGRQGGGPASQTNTQTTQPADGQ